MPWHLEKQNNGYVVVDDKGKKYSDKPLSKWRATRQMRALYANDAKWYATEKQIVEHTGVMVALPLPEVYQLTQGILFPPGADVLPPEDIHLTLAFLGDAKSIADPNKLFSICEKFVASHDPIIGTINGYGNFLNTEPDGKSCLWLSLDAPALPDLRQELVKVLTAGGYPPMANHGFMPHITLAYYNGEFTPSMADLLPVDVMVPDLRVAWSEMNRYFSFGVKGPTYMNTTTKALMKDGMPASCYLVVEDPQKVTTWHLPVKSASGKPDHALMGAAWAALMSPGGHRGNKYEGPGKQAAISKLRALYKSEKMPIPGEKSFSVFKQADGSYRWVIISSSAFRDKDNEIVTSKALEEDVIRCDKSREYGPLRWFHIGGFEHPDGAERWDTWKAGPGLDLGTCDFNMLHGKMLIESGTFKDAATGEAFSQVAGDLEVSLGFSHPVNEPDKDGGYWNIHRFERSLLPSGMASNVLTKVYVTKGVVMKASEKLAALVAILKDKPDLAKQILADAETVQKAAEDAGLEFKEVQELFPVEKADEEPAVDTPPDPEPTEPDPAAAEPPASDTAQMPEVIGDMSPVDLTKFVIEVVSQMTAPKNAELQTKEASQDSLITDALAALKSLGDRLTALDTSLKSVQQSLDDLTDARPVGIKQMQSRRPTENPENVVKEAPVGPTMDDFRKFAIGGK